MTTATPTEKPCSKCGEVKPLADYHRDARLKDGHAARCKACAAAHRQTYVKRVAAERVEPAPTDTKTCTECGVEKPYTEYSRDKAKRDGYVARCKVCAAARYKAYRERVATERIEPAPTDTKACAECGVEKPITEYHRDSDKKDGHRTWCKACVSAYQKARYEADRDRICAYQKAYREQNHDEVAARQKAWRDANLDRVAARKKTWHAERWATDAEYRAQRRAIQTRRYRLLASAKQEPYTRQSIFERDGWVCGICDEPIDPTIRYEDDPRACATLDHVIPLSRGGDDTPANVQAAHGSCNYGKCDRVEDDELEVAA